MKRALWRFHNSVCTVHDKNFKLLTFNPHLLLNWLCPFCLIRPNRYLWIEPIGCWGVSLLTFSSCLLSIKALPSRFSGYSGIVSGSPMGGLHFAQPTRCHPTTLNA